MRPSLLWPGKHALQLPRSDGIALAAVYVLAVVVRWPIRLAHPYTAEASHFVAARNLWDGVLGIRSMYPWLPPEDFSWFFWQRPLLSLLMWPSASLGWEAYRTTHVLAAGLVPVLGAVLLRQMGVRPVYAYGAAAVLAIHPVLVPWGVIVLPDTMVCVFTLAGLIAAHNGRPWATGALLLTGSWIKEVGFVTALSLAVLAWYRDADGTGHQPWPLQRGRFAWILLAVAALSLLPLWVSMQLPSAAFPGFRTGGDMDATIERLFLLLWLAPVPLLGLADARVRRLCLVALAWPAFFLVYHEVTGKAIEVWYNVIPATMVLLASAAVLSSLHDRLAADGRPVRRAARRALAYVAPALGAVLLAGLVVQVLVPQVHPVNRAVATPLTGTGQWNLDEALAYEEVRDDDLYAAMAAVPAGLRTAWLALDLDWSLVMYPVADQADQMYKDYTGQGPLTEDHVRWWADAIETRADATLMTRQATPLNQGIRDAYAPCSQEHGHYVLILPQDCQGYGDRLVAAHDRAAGLPPKQP